MEVFVVNTSLHGSCQNLSPQKPIRLLEATFKLLGLSEQKKRLSPFIVLDRLAGKVLASNGRVRIGF